MKFWLDAETANEIIDRLEVEINDLSAQVEILAKENATLRRTLDRTLAVLVYLERHRVAA